MSVPVKQPFALGSLEKPLSGFKFKDYNIYDCLGDLVDEMKEVVEQGQYTPDFPILQKKESHYVFVYGTLKRDFRNHQVLSGSKVVGCGFSESDRFVMAKELRHRFPVAFFDNRVESRGRLYGEVYEVKPEVIRDLDYLESNGIMYKRYPLMFEVFQRTGPKQKIRAWVYLGIKEYWSDRASNLDIGRYVKPHNGDNPYYIFTMADDKRL